ncbi:MAG: 16S rRNA (guanine(527)-N(7))-methyltransferase RsmG [Mycoplasmoidaceae bacterium]
MNFKNFKENILKIFPWTSEADFEKILIYKNFLQFENKKFNLTGLSEDDKIFANYFYESIFIFSDFLEKDSKKEIIDIGSGSGIPGILLAIFYKLCFITIVESNYKKCLFMKNLIEKLDLNNITIINKRAELISNEMREKFDIATSRAVSKLRIILELSVPYVKINGFIIEPKSILLEEELFEANKIIKLLDIELKEIKELEFSGKLFKTAFFQKNKKTDQFFPRNWKSILLNQNFKI